MGKSGDRVSSGVVGRAGGGSAAGEAGETRIGRIGQSRTDRLGEQGAQSVFDRTGQGLIRLLARMPLIRRPRLARFKPRGGYAVTPARALVLARSPTAC